jgi:hypothetical protein
MNFRKKLHYMKKIVLWKRKKHRADRRFSRQTCPAHGCGKMDIVDQGFLMVNV